MILSMFDTMLSTMTPTLAAAEGEANLLGFNWLEAAFNLLLFIILLVLLSKFAWPHILQGLQAREEKIRHDIVGAEKANRDAQQTLEQYKQQLAEAHAEVRKLLDQARSDGEAVRGRMIAEAEKEIARFKDRATQDIQQAKQQALQELHGHTAELAVAVAEKILQRQIDGQDNRRLVEQSLAELDKLN